MNPSPHPAPWDSSFETILRNSLSLLDGHAPLAPDASLTALGLDSMHTVELLIDLEETYGITLPDEALTAQTFATPGNLWQEISAARSPAPAPQRGTP